MGHVVNLVRNLVMVFSLLARNDGVNFKTAGFKLARLPPTTRRPRIFMAELSSYLRKLAKLSIRDAGHCT